MATLLLVSLFGVWRGSALLHTVSHSHIEIELPIELGSRTHSVYRDGSCIGIFKTTAHRNMVTEVHFQGALLGDKQQQITLEGEAQFNALSQLQKGDLSISSHENTTVYAVRGVHPLTVSFTSKRGDRNVVRQSTVEGVASLALGAKKRGILRSPSEQPFIQLQEWIKELRFQKEGADTDRCPNLVRDKK